MKKVARVIGWNMLFLLLGVIVIELIFGSWFRAPNLWHLSIYRNVEWQMKTDHVYLRDEPVTYIRDYYGLRGSHGTPENVDLLVLGGSTTDERFVSEGETWPDVLQACLRENDLEVTLANAGVTGQTTKGHAANFDLWLNHIPDLKPGVILSYIGVNEPFVSGLADKDDVRLFTESESDVSQLRIFRKWIYMNSAINAGGKVLKDMLKGGGPEFARVHEAPHRDEVGLETVERKILEAAPTGLVYKSEAYEAMVAAVEAREQDRLDGLAMRMDTLTAKIRDFGSIPVYVAQGWGSYRLLDDGTLIGDADRRARVDAYNRVIMAHCESEGLMCLDLADASPFEAGDMWDEVHTTPQGSARIGNAMCDHFKGSEDFVASLALGGK